MGRTSVTVGLVAAWLMLWGTALDAGLITVTSFKMPTGAQEGYVLTCDESGVGTWQPASGGGGGGWSLTGNAGTVPGTNFLGTTDNVELVLCVNGQAALRLEPAGLSPNVIGGYGGNFPNAVTPGVHGGTVGGGGSGPDLELGPRRNTVTDHFGTVGGGQANRAGDDDQNVGNAMWATVAGGMGNVASGLGSTVGGGSGNQATAAGSSVLGGQNNHADQEFATVAGGDANIASGSYSFAAGRQANATNQGSFVWADSTDAAFASSRNNEFAIRASGGLRVNSSNSSYGAVINNQAGGGDGLRLNANVSISEDWGALYATNYGTSPAVVARNQSANGRKAYLAGPNYGVKSLGNIQVWSADGSRLIVELGEGLDYAEGFDVSNKEEAAPGTVLIIDPESPGKLKVSGQAYDRKVAGIVAGGKGLGSGVRLGGHQHDRHVALAGRVYCNVDATHGAVSPGDLLTTSPTPGHAMVVKDPARAQGAILGKAMEALPEGTTGQILVLVTLQ